MQPKLKLLASYLDTATSLIECEHTNSSFIQRMLKTAALILVSYSAERLDETAKEKWLIKMLSNAMAVKGARNLVENIEFKTLYMLKVICKFRQN